MKRHEFITLIGGVAAAWPLTARAQQAGKVWRTGYGATFSFQTVVKPGRELTGLEPDRSA